jgi:hypothetical protein
MLIMVNLKAMKNGQFTSEFTGSEIAISWGYAYNTLYDNSYGCKCKIDFLHTEIPLWEVEILVLFFIDERS